jgi:hypothetical protein
MEKMMSRIFEDFMSNQWNVYGLQMLAGSLMVIVLHNYLSIMGMCAMGVCVYLIAMCQRILGVRHGMMFYEKNINAVSDIKKLIKKSVKKNKEKKK